MYREGDAIIDKLSGKSGYVLHVYPDGVTARFGGMTAVRCNSDIKPAPLDIRREDLTALQHLAVETNDKEWFMQISERLGAAVHE